jgi:acetylornithine deacetylase
VITAGKQHNVVPDVCHYTIDCRVNECYSLEEVLEILRGLVQAELTPRSTRLQSSKIPDGHPVLAAAAALGMPTFGSPTLSDQALMSFPSVKIGPGHSGRSHTADEFIYLEELKQGIQTYQNLLSHLI